MTPPFCFTTEERQEIARILEYMAKRSQYRQTLNQLIKRWTDFVRTVERVYEDSIYDYTNELSVRDILEEILTSIRKEGCLKIKEVLDPWDERFTKTTRPIDKPLREKEGGSKYTWWSRVPLVLEGELKGDLQDEGVV